MLLIQLLELPLCQPKCMDIGETNNFTFRNTWSHIHFLPSLAGIYLVTSLLVHIVSSCGLPCTPRSHGRRRPQDEPVPHTSHISAPFSNTPPPHDYHCDTTHTLQFYHSPPLSLLAIPSWNIPSHLAISAYCLALRSAVHPWLPWSEETRTWAGPPHFPHFAALFQHTSAWLSLWHHPHFAIWSQSPLLCRPRPHFPHLFPNISANDSPSPACFSVTSSPTTSKRPLTTQSAALLQTPLGNVPSLGAPPPPFLHLDPVCIETETPLFSLCDPTDRCPLIYIPEKRKFSGILCFRQQRSRRRPPPRFIVSAITFEGFKLRSSNLTHALFIQISRKSSITDIVVQSKMAAGGHFVQKFQKK